MKTLNQFYKTLDSCAPFNGDAEKRAEYLEQCLKHIMAIAKNGCKEKRIIETVEESIGWLTPHETAFAVDYVQNAQILPPNRGWFVAFSEWTLGQVAWGLHKLRTKLENVKVQ